MRKGIRTAVFINIALATATVYASGSFAAYAEEREETELSTGETVIELSDESKQNEELLFCKYKEDSGSDYECVRYLPDGTVYYAHHYTKSVIKAPTCTEQGYEKYICDVCGEEVCTEFPVKDHVYEDGECVVCGKIWTSTDADNVNVAPSGDNKEDFSAESAYLNYSRMPNETMRENYLESLDEDDREELKTYIKQHVTDCTDETALQEDS